MSPPTPVEDTRGKAEVRLLALPVTGISSG